MSDNDPSGDGDRARPKHDGSRGPSFRSYKRDFMAYPHAKAAPLQAPKPADMSPIPFVGSTTRVPPRK